MYRPFTRALAMLAFSATLLAPAVALAAPQTDVWTAAQVTLADLEAQKVPTYVVALDMDDAVKLPTTEQVAVLVPNDTEVVWAGEIFADPSKDMPIKVEAKKGDDGQLLIFDVRASHTVQFELSAPPGTIERTPDGQKIALAWFPGTTLSKARLRVVAPVGLAAQDATGVEEIKLQDGTTGYYKDFDKVASDETLNLDLTLVQGSAAPAAGEATGTATATPAPPAPQESAPAVPGRTVIIVLALAGIAAAVAAIIVITMRKSKSAE